MIQLRDALQQMETTDRRGFMQPFSIKYVGYDKRRNKAGTIHSFESCTLCSSKGKHKSKSFAKLVAKKKQNHFTNATRNIKLANGEIKTVHIWLITFFNNQKVAWNIHG